MAAVLPAELRRAVIAHAKSGGGNVAGAGQQEQAGLLEPHLFLDWSGLKAVTARKFRWNDDTLIPHRPASSCTRSG